MNIAGFKAIVAIAIILECFTFGILPLYTLHRINPRLQQRILGFCNAIAGGIFLSSGFIHLLAGISLMCGCVEKLLHSTINNKEAFNGKIHRAYLRSFRSSSSSISLDSIETLNHELTDEVPLGLLLACVGFLATFFIEKVMLWSGFKNSTYLITILLLLPPLEYLPMIDPLLLLYSIIIGFGFIIDDY